MGSGPGAGCVPRRHDLGRPRGVFRVAPPGPLKAKKNEQGQSPAQISSLSMNPGVAAFFRARQRVTAPMDCPPKTWTAEVHLLMVPRDRGTLAHQISFVTYRTQLAGKYSSCGAILYRSRTLAL